jgi:hypothetical protein
LNTLRIIGFSLMIGLSPAIASVKSWKNPAGRGKRLFVQVQDASSSPGYRSVPSYLISAAYDGGVT